VRKGQEVTVTDHGRLVAWLVPIDALRVIDRLIAEGVVMPARVPKRRREGRLPTAKGSVSELVAQQRR
jgi:antitoxin (DNA-binding transcriptional repressor) of toxin-antitoxin stability system